MKQAVGQWSADNYAATIMLIMTNVTVSAESWTGMCKLHNVSVSTFVHRLFFKDMQHKALEKKSNIEYLEQIGWQQFLPKFVIEGIPVRLINSCSVCIRMSELVYAVSCTVKSH